MKQMINRIREKIRHSQLGSATIEAVVAFTGFLFVIFTILNIVNLCRAQMLISNAMDTVTKELTQYSYFYEISGLQKFENELQAISENGDLDLNTIASSVGNLYTALSDGASSSEAEMRGLANSLQEGTLSSSSVSTALQNIDTEKNEVLAAMESMEAQMEGLLDNPVAYLKSIVAVAGSQGLETLKSRAIAAPLAKSLMVKHFGDNRAEANASLERLGVVDGLNGMNFNMSTIFQKNHKDEIHLVVYYKVKVVQLFKWADFEATICKETRARAWLGGDDVEFRVVAAISDSESTGGDETRGIGETSSVEGDDEEGSGDDEDSDSHTGDTGLEEYLASVNPEIIAFIKQSYDTSGWTEEQWHEAVNGLPLGFIAFTDPTATPAPTEVPQSTATPAPTTTPEPTVTPEPTSAPQVIPTDVDKRLNELVDEIRKDIKKDYPRGNAGAVITDIEGVTSEIIAYSGFNNATSPNKPSHPEYSFDFGEGARIFETMEVNTNNIINGEGAFDRGVDTESKILEDIAHQLGYSKFTVDETIKGNVYLITERPPCPSCQSVIEQFKQMFPNVNVIVESKYE